jgi:hypothetical protein
VIEVGLATPPICNLLLSDVAAGGVAQGHRYAKQSLLISDVFKYSPKLVLPSSSKYSFPTVLELTIPLLLLLLLEQSASLIFKWFGSSKDDKRFIQIRLLL